MNWLPSVILLVLGLVAGVMSLLTTLPVQTTLHQIRIVASIALGIIGVVAFLWAEDEEA